jgi:hypothetical protein
MKMLLIVVLLIEGTAKEDTFNLLHDAGLLVVPSTQPSTLPIITAHYFTVLRVHDVELSSLCSACSLLFTTLLTI